MNQPIDYSSKFELADADRVGVAASILCAIHCGLAPVLLIMMPTFGRIWAHPASHAIVALFIVPLAAFSIYKGYRTHRKRWVMSVASIGVLFVVGGAMLPAFSAGGPHGEASMISAPDVNLGVSACSDVDCESCATEIMLADEEESTECIDECCPSIQMSEDGAMSLNIPTAAVITTLGGFFLIAAHIGNLCSCRHACRTRVCCECT
ncbi:MerC domain-containing protein [Rubritalea sp.]|uniref:MerC domain-containing protein n=1 Tax=Rubritalea sp. TaxID=2109375 RepID=UPI003EF5CC58